MTWMRLLCPECHRQFASQGMARFCPLCGYDTQGEDLTEIITSPNIGSGLAKGIDGHYRAMEEGAAFRAQVADDPSLKLTNIKDNLRAGDTAEMPIQNAVTQVMDQRPGVFGWQGGATQGLQYSQAAHTGLLPNAGAKAMKALRQDHGMAGGVTTDRPALETQQPGYRQRA